MNLRSFQKFDTWKQTIPDKSSWPAVEPSNEIKQKRLGKGDNCSNDRFTGRDEYNALETNKVQKCHSRVNNVTNIFYAAITGKRTGRVYRGGEIQGPIRSGSPRHFLPWHSKALWGVKASRPSARVVSIGRMRRRMLLNGNRYTLFRQPRVCFAFDSLFVDGRHPYDRIHPPPPLPRISGAELPFDVLLVSYHELDGCLFGDRRRQFFRASNPWPPLFLVWRIDEFSARDFTSFDMASFNVCLYGKYAQTGKLGRVGETWNIAAFYPSQASFSFLRSRERRGAKKVTYFERWLFLKVTKGNVNVWSIEIYQCFLFADSFLGLRF